ncbi:MAG: hypothetical protein F6K18_27555 [Okeania sp. SIO2C2]|uniref:hypothetical protein n=1 Tax=Okeania sp. SIO2C2 TaxID=2607787 RepID=UPI0013BB39B1|nr:hypothetical protein [Okeania sp. SIO2C2]NEP90284.1 hypothetical protein [Okeania sp. SIO2C2]
MWRYPTIGPSFPIPPLPFGRARDFPPGKLKACSGWGYGECGEMGRWGDRVRWYRLCKSKGEYLQEI